MYQYTHKAPSASTPCPLHDKEATACCPQVASAHEVSQCACVTGGQALPSEVARAVVLEAVQHFFGSASSLEAEEIGLGQVALSLLPHDPEVQQQGMCLQALQELQDYGLHLLPADYNQVRHAVAFLCCAPKLADLQRLSSDQDYHLLNGLALL